ncbi:MAG TPA: type VI secretion system tip protein TssI/VgrG [Sandaracinaceae bacterium LLY-WYZ-13_1]|nr:type VI secretion system tip protein TssI/VgrG [Sandaracinaceae bacterium LLY-WYZ-13_1]
MSEDDNEHRPSDEVERGAQTADEAADGLGKNIGGLIDDDPDDSTREDVESAFGTASDVAGAAEDGAKAWGQTEDAARAAREGDAAGVFDGVTGDTGATAGHVAENLGALGHVTGDEGVRDAARAAGIVQSAADFVGGVARQVEGLVERAEDAAHARSRRVDYEIHIEGGDGWALRQLELTEALGEPYEMVLEVHSQDEDADPRELVGVDVEVLLDRRDHNRRVCGIVRRVEESSHRGHRVAATLHVVPALWGLGQGRDSVIFQDQSAEEALQTVLERHLGPYGREVDLGGLEESYPAREFTVQYQESHLSFCARLMQEEGIGYYFDFDGDGWEKVVLFERNGQLPEVPTLDGGAVPFISNAEVVGRAEPVVRFEPSRELTANYQTVRDFDWTQGRTRVEAWVEGEDEQGRARAVYDHGHGRTVTLYDFQRGGRYGANDVDRQAQIRHERLLRDADRFEGVSLVTGLAPGRTFELSGHPTPGVDGEYLVTRVVHRSAPVPGLEDGGAEDYHNTFECIPVDVPWRPARRAPKPAIYGVQTALVTGSNEGEIHTDEYGRIQVRFHWDREAAEPQTSCWIRVAQTWAGHDGMGYPGFVFIPRVGMEVVVTFVNGDPDRPLVTGAVYNGTNLPPQAMPDEASRSMIRTRSLGGSGYNELSFEDASGQEEVHLRAERDLRELVRHNHSTEVHANQTNHVGGNQEIHVEGDHRRVHVDRVERYDVDGNRHLTVGGGEGGGMHEVIIHGPQSVEVDFDEIYEVHGHRNVTVDQGHEETITGGSTVTVAGGVTQTIRDGGWEMSTTGNVSHGIAGSHSVDASQHINLVGGGTGTFRTEQAMTLQAQEITMTSSTAINVRAPKGIQNLTPAAEQNILTQTLTQASDAAENIASKFGAYAMAISIVGMKFDTVGLKMEAYGAKFDESGFKLSKGSTEIKAGATRIYRAAVSMFG